MPETYAPVLLRRKVAQLRRDTGNPDIFAMSDSDVRGARHIITVALTRPFKMLIYESIVSLTCMYLSLAYAIFYLYFEAYPIVFQGPRSKLSFEHNGFEELLNGMPGIYHFSAGVAGLAFLPSKLLCYHAAQSSG